MLHESTIIAYSISNDIQSDHKHVIYSCNPMSARHARGTSKRGCELFHGNMMDDGGLSFRPSGVMLKSVQMLDFQRACVFISFLHPAMSNVIEVLPDKNWCYWHYFSGIIWVPPMRYNEGKSPEFDISKISFQLNTVFSCND